MPGIFQEKKDAPCLRVHKPVLSPGWRACRAAVSNSAGYHERPQGQALQPLFSPQHVLGKHRPSVRSDMAAPLALSSG